MNHQVTTYDVEAPTNLDLLVGMIRKTADEQSVGWIQSVSVRMPMVAACSIEALAQYSGQSRNKIIVKALDAALDLLWEQLPEDERKEVEKLRSMILEHKLEAHQRDASQTESGEV